MSYEYEDELERMKKRRQQKKQRNGSRNRESDFISAHQEEFENRKISRAKAARRRKKKKRIILMIEILALIILACVIFSVIKKKNDDGYWTIAVFGVDSRDGNLGKGSLSDVEMICNIDKKTGEVKIVSVFRDTYLKISSKGEYHKINEAYFKGGPKQAVAALEENLDLSIDSYATFNWKAVVDAINILGGVDVEISDAEFAYINSFITETVNSTGVGSYQLKKAGMNHLDGVQAVAYARLRLMDTDFNRTARQRKIVELAMEKAKNADWATRNNVLVTVFPQILRTSVSMT
ncbi:LCP family protein [Clostridium sp. AM58-1XD]|uniref:LCP family protein n=1 Tax=Clostridium sp. AM58-1XD TaxID=2292307 RepID=UPI001FA82521|nr:LCP family protein [Clostridium sp. AM58-1XD]